MSTDLFQARETIKQQRNAGTLINACGKDKQLTAIILDNGAVVASPLSVQRLMTAIEKSNSKSAQRIKPPSETTRLVAYDVRDNDPDTQNEIDYEEISAVEDEQ